MATSQKKPHFPLDGFVKEIRPDPGKAGENLKVFCGFLGASSEKDSIRVYFDEALNQFVDFKEADVVHAIKLTEQESSLGGCKLWVKASAEYVFGNPEQTQRPKGRFLQGNLVQDFNNQYGVQGRVGIPGPQGPITGLLGCPQPSNLGGCFKSLFDPICNDKFATFLNTCIGHTCDLVTCHKSCLAPSCFNTCLQLTCHTCFAPPCGVKTIQQPTCFTCNRTCFAVTCNHPICNIRASNQLCPTEIVSAACQFDPIQPGINPNIQGTGFENFNPLAGM